MGWPENKSQVSNSVLAYYDIRDELTMQDLLVSKGPLLVVPSILRREMIELVQKFICRNVMCVCLTSHSRAKSRFSNTCLQQDHGLK